MLVTTEVYSWLKGLGVLKEANPTASRTEPNKIQLSSHTTNAFETGIKVAELLTALFREIQKEVEVKVVKRVSSPASKLYNWSLLAEALREHLRVDLAEDTRRLIVGGDTELISMLVSELHDIHKQWTSEQAHMKAEQRKQQQKKRHKEAALGYKKKLQQLQGITPAGTTKGSPPKVSYFTGEGSPRMRRIAKQQDKQEHQRSAGQLAGLSRENSMKPKKRQSHSKTPPPGAGPASHTDNQLAHSHVTAAQSAPSVDVPLHGLASSSAASLAGSPSLARSSWQVPPMPASVTPHRASHPDATMAGMQHHGNPAAPYHRGGPPPDRHRPEAGDPSRHPATYYNLHAQYPPPQDPHSLQQHPPAPPRGAEAGHQQHWHHPHASPHQYPHEENPHLYPPNSINHPQTVHRHAAASYPQNLGPHPHYMQQGQQPTGSQWQYPHSSPVPPQMMHQQYQHPNAVGKQPDLPTMLPHAAPTPSCVEEPPLNQQLPPLIPQQPPRPLNFPPSSSAPLAALPPPSVHSSSAHVDPRGGEKPEGAAAVVEQEQRVTRGGPPPVPYPHLPVASAPMEYEEAAVTQIPKNAGRRGMSKAQAAGADTKGKGGASPNNKRSSGNVGGKGASSRSHPSSQKATNAKGGTASPKRGRSSVRAAPSEKGGRSPRQSSGSSTGRRGRGNASSSDEEEEQRKRGSVRSVRSSRSEAKSTRGKRGDSRGGKSSRHAAAPLSQDLMMMDDEDALSIFPEGAETEGKNRVSAFFVNSLVHTIGVTPEEAAALLAHNGRALFQRFLDPQPQLEGGGRFPEDEADFAALFTTGAAGEEEAETEESLLLRKQRGEDELSSWVDGLLCGFAYLCDAVRQEPTELYRSFATMQGGLVSTRAETRGATCRLLGLCAQSLASSDPGFLEDLFFWLIRSGALPQLLAIVNASNEMGMEAGSGEVCGEMPATSAVELVASCAQTRLLTLVADSMKPLFDDAIGFLLHVSALCRRMLTDRRLYAAFWTQGAAEYTIEFASLQAQVGRSSASRGVAVQLMVDLWVAYCGPMNGRPELASQVLTTIKHCTQEPRRSLQLSIHAALFHLLEELCARHSPLTSLVFRLVVFAFIELGLPPDEPPLDPVGNGDGGGDAFNEEGEADLRAVLMSTQAAGSADPAAIAAQAHLPATAPPPVSDDSVRDFVLTCLCRFAETTPGMPVGVLLEPYCKQLREQSLEEETGKSRGGVSLWDGLAVKDIELLLELAKHKRLSLQHAIVLADVCGLVSLHNCVFGRATSLPLVLAVSRYGSEPEMLEWCSRFAKVCLTYIVQAPLVSLGAGKAPEGLSHMRSVLAVEVLSKLLHMHRANDDVCEVVKTHILEICRAYMWTFLDLHPDLKLLAAFFPRELNALEFEMAQQKEERDLGISEEREVIMDTEAFLKELEERGYNGEMGEPAKPVKQRSQKDGGEVLRSGQTSRSSMMSETSDFIHSAQPPPADGGTLSEKPVPPSTKGSAILSRQSSKHGAGGKDMKAAGSSGEVPVPLPPPPPTKKPDPVLSDAERFFLEKLHDEERDAWMLQGQQQGGEEGRIIPPYERRHKAAVAVLQAQEPPYVKNSSLNPEWPLDPAPPKRIAVSPEEQGELVVLLSHFRKSLEKLYRLPFAPQEKDKGGVGGSSKEFLGSEKDAVPAGSGAAAARKRLGSGERGDSSDQPQTLKGPQGAGRKLRGSDIPALLSMAKLHPSRATGRQVSQLLGELAGGGGGGGGKESGGRPQGSAGGRSDLGFDEFEQLVCQIAFHAFHPEEATRFLYKGVPLPRPKSNKAKQLQALLQYLVAVSAGAYIEEDAPQPQGPGPRRLSWPSVPLRGLSGSLQTDLQGLAEKYIVRTLNVLSSQLAEGKMPQRVPDGFAIKDSWKEAPRRCLPPSLPMRASQRMVAELLDEVLERALGVSCLDDHAIAVPAKVAVVLSDEPIEWEEWLDTGKDTKEKDKEGGGRKKGFQTQATREIGMSKRDQLKQELEERERRERASAEEKRRARAQLVERRMNSMRERRQSAERSSAPSNKQSSEATSRERRASREENQKKLREFDQRQEEYKKHREDWEKEQVREKERAMHASMQPARSTSFGSSAPSNLKPRNPQKTPSLPGTNSNTDSNRHSDGSRRAGPSTNRNRTGMGTIWEEKPVASSAPSKPRGGKAGENKLPVPEVHLKQQQRRRIPFSRVLSGVSPPASGDASEGPSATTNTDSAPSAPPSQSQPPTQPTGPPPKPKAAETDPKHEPSPPTPKMPPVPIAFSEAPKSEEAPTEPVSSSQGT
uniref:Uncharacterized protein n=1 Tax=Chromera velia CCMP2878 TaxID=1169474 RepID=A0A0G4GIA0_9ALVE|eukprot:Cvel_22025.t1-p1 / transcript=Cvel_22025.t1 / gene=Cvel_22025 / organism=Chromera_velia_CCMP2878 / gene_product=hypothetical protein / transcript_product=hypothetical protein / location=Cvel_scaffold2125:1605-13656(-) / protein_length=2274 / sequence_SO=supercontig / SO=protein_coding / is_pseudo=false